jgi:hypothetical protein
LTRDPGLLELERSTKERSLRAAPVCIFSGNMKGVLYAYWGDIMKKVILGFVILVLWISPSLAETHDSPFGFTIEIPPHWLIISKQEVKANPDLFNFEDEHFKNANKAMLEQVKSMVISGKVEIYLNQNTFDHSFTDNINVTKTFARLPQTLSEKDQACEQLPEVLTQGFGKPIRVYECGFRKVAGLEAFYADYDGVIDGTRNIQYQIQKSPSTIIVITATCKNRSLESIRKEFEDIVASLTLK